MGLPQWKVDNPAHPHINLTFISVTQTNSEICGQPDGNIVANQGGNPPALPNVGAVPNPGAFMPALKQLIKAVTTDVARATVSGD